MQISSILLILAVFVMVGAYLYLPFMARSRRARAGESHEVSALKAERDRVINSLQELDFDFNLGKIPSMSWLPPLRLRSTPKRGSKKPQPQVASTLTPSLSSAKRTTTTSKP